MIKSPIKWMGSKKKLIKHILELVSEYNYYIEPFMGSGIVFFSLEPENSLCTDFAAEPIAVMNAIKNSPFKLIEKFKELANNLWEKGEKYYYDLRSFYNKNKDSMDDVNRASYFIFLINSCFNGVIRFNPNKNYSWNVPYGKRGYKEVHPYWLKNKEIKPSKIYNNNFDLDIINFHEFLNKGNKIFKKCSFQESILQAKKGDLIYCDPPYLVTDKVYIDVWSEKEELELAELLKNADKKGIKFILSNVYEYKNIVNEKLMELYKNFKYKLIDYQYIITNNKQKVKEILIYN